MTDSEERPNKMRTNPQHRERNRLRGAGEGHVRFEVRLCVIDSSLQPQTYRRGCWDLSFILFAGAYLESPRNTAVRWGHRLISAENSIINIENGYQV